mmetsp:Transcript_249/g.454  ORF Transcript_249/g.454 Transcript_249/m.454 type:complete len:599 (+) Transcript_249:32-1828(+)
MDFSESDEELSIYSDPAMDTEDFSNMRSFDDIVHDVINENESKRESSVEDLIFFLDRADSEFLVKNFNFLTDLAYKCPFENVSKPMKQYVSQLAKEISMNLSLPMVVSTFINLQNLPPLMPGSNSEIDQNRHELLVKRFLKQGFVSNLERILVYHPSHFQHFFDTYDYLLGNHAESTLPASWRHYIACIAAARFNCTYVIKHHMNEFLLFEGCESWLSDSTTVPSKLANLSQLNAYLAHQPWLIRDVHIKQLLECGWTIRELIHAICLMVEIHGTCSIILGCGILYEYPDKMTNKTEHFYTSTTTTEGSPLNDNMFSTPPQNEHNIEDIEDSKDIRDNTEKWLRKIENSKDDDFSPKKKKKDSSSRKEKKKYVRDPHPQWITQKFQDSKNVKVAKRTFTPLAAKFINDGTIEGYVEYKLKLVPLDNFNWDVHAFALIDRFFSGCATRFDHEFKSIFNLTYKKLSRIEGKTVDTTQFRLFIRIYIQRLHGLSNDTRKNYDREVNGILPRGTKTYIRNVATFPEIVDRNMFQNLELLLDDSERVHINLVAATAKKQCGLIYASKAIQNLYSLNTESSPTTNENSTPSPSSSNKPRSVYDD